jgi:serine/threonine protein kinase
MTGSAALDPRPGVVLGDGRYRLDQLIGSGGMATVWRATDRRLARTVAIKLISDALADDPTYAERFAREARTAAGLSHANLVQVYDYGADDRRPFLVMEYVDGGTLSERLERGPVRGDEAAAVAGDLLSALACIHSAGILHRDVKPANVLLSSDGRSRITDFGIAHPEDSTRLTQTGHLVGTLRYLAPEVIDGQPASRRSDLYALGVLLRDLSAGEPDQTTEELVHRLTDPQPGGRPATAEAARRLLGRTPDPAYPTDRLAGPALPTDRLASPVEPTDRLASPVEPTDRLAAPVEPTDRLAAPADGAGIPRFAPPVAPAPSPVERRRPRPPADPRPRPRPADRRPAPAARRRGRARRLPRIAGIAAACLVLAVAVALLASRLGGGGTGSAATPPTAKPAASRGARPGLTSRLDELERLVRAASQP